MPYTRNGIGYRYPDPSRRAAEAAAPNAPTIRDEVLAMLRMNVGGLTADEIAQRLGRHYGSVRPRLSELRRDGLAVDTGRRRTNGFGKTQIVYAVAITAPTFFDRDPELCADA